MKRILEKIYVKVNSDFDSTGYMMPRTITWADGRTFKIDEVKDFRPASTLAKGHSGDCYTVVIRGEEKFLFFEKTDDLFASRVGRWVPLKKQSKKEQRKFHARSRRDWNGLKPTTRVVKSKKVYNRKKIQKPGMDE